MRSATRVGEVRPARAPRVGPPQAPSADEGVLTDGTPAVEQVLGTGVEREGAGEPDGGDLQRVLVRQRGDDTVPIARSCTSVLILADLRAGIDTPRRPTQER